MISKSKWIVEHSNLDGEVTQLGTYPDYGVASDVVHKLAFDRGETLDPPDDSGNDEFVFDVNILDDDGEWVYAPESYIVRKDASHD